MLKPQKIRLVAMSLSGIYSLQQLSRFSPSSLSSGQLFYCSMSMRKGLRGSGLLFDSPSSRWQLSSSALGCSSTVGQKTQARECRHQMDAEARNETWPYQGRCHRVVCGMLVACWTPISEWQCLKCAGLLKYRAQDASKRVPTPDGCRGMHHETC
jgi:hypothetical protein